MNTLIQTIITEKKAIFDRMEQNNYYDIVESAAVEMANAIRNGHKILLAGNGGSAADAQHFAGEIVGRYLLDRPAMPAISLCTDPTTVTSISNDYGYDFLFSRQLQGLGAEGDIFVAISTSGNSKNLMEAIQVARKKGIMVVSFLGKGGGKMKDLSDYALVVPSDETPRIQEIHTLTVHLLCELIEKELYA